MARFKVGVHLRPQHTTIQALRTAWKGADQLGVDCITTWDHFYPLSGDPAGSHFECWSLMAAMACETSHARIGSMVSSVGYRNPSLIADMARTIDHLSGGRFNLGLGAGNSARDYQEFGFEFGTPASRLKYFREVLPVIKSRLAKLNPPPVGPLPILIGGGGEKVTLRLVAQYADICNFGGTPEEYARRSGLLDDWCQKVGRNPADIEHSTNLPPSAVSRVDEYLKAGVQLFLVQLDHPFDLEPVKPWLAAANK
ncbi:MAG: LLM class F420-dependent oxidoreductase [Dehalococcoidia bacterium]|nr:LLM class F420-dependent oxidoreductase [Dehalococcoidia bacterium]